MVPCCTPDAKRGPDHAVRPPSRQIRSDATMPLRNGQRVGTGFSQRRLTC